MKTFAYTLRDSAGALKKGSLNAADRADALKKISDMGCIPVAVSEGKGPSRPLVTFKNGARIFFAAVCVLSAFLVFFLLVSFFRTRPEQKNPPPVKLVTAKAHREVRLEKTVPKIVMSEPIVDQSPSVPRVDVTVSLPDRSPVITRPPSLKRVRDATPRYANADTNIAQDKQTPIPFKSTTEQILSMAMSVPPGAEIPPLPIPKNLDADFVSSLENTIVIDDNDDDRSAAIKESVADAKNKMLELIKEGRSVSDVLKEYEQQTNERSAIHRQAQLELNNIYRTESPQKAKAFMDEVNKSLIELGIDPIALPRR